MLQVPSRPSVIAPFLWIKKTNRPSASCLLRLSAAASRDEYGTPRSGITGKAEWMGNGRFLGGDKGPTRSVAVDEGRRLALVGDGTDGADGARDASWGLESQAWHSSEGH